MTLHRQIPVLDPASSQMIEVDEGIAPLLQAIWRSRIATCNSCQENRPGIIWIEFPRAEDAESFLTCIVSGLDSASCPEEDGWLYARMMGQAEGRYASWQYRAHPHDFREDVDWERGTVELKASEPCAIALSVSIRFPVQDYKKLLELMIRGGRSEGN
ncbi:MAG: hypothetical protein HPY61_07750 [Methanotrichaceae archaeon]|nr:hypothetical protein [Methanotrichaceae archaeon]